MNAGYPENCSVGPIGVVGPLSEKKNRGKTPENRGYGKSGCGSVHHWHWLRVA